MTVCRYFRQGTCRFGDRCRFEHVQEYDSNRGNERYRNQNYSQDRYSRYDQYSHQTQRFTSPNRYNEHQSYNSPDANNRYRDGNKYTSPDRHSDYRGHNTYESRAGYDPNYRYLPERYTPETSFPRTPNRVANDSRYSNKVYNENAYGQNRFRWSSEDYSKQKQQTHQYSASPAHPFSKTSTPRSNVPFSFKVPDSEIKRTPYPTDFQIDEGDSIYAEIVKEDAMAWELGKQWPFSCYFPCSDKPAFPGFTDISPEELRYEAYRAKENNTYDSYCESVNNALQEVSLKRAELKIPSAQLINTLRKIRKGEHMPAYSTGVGFQFLQPSNQSGHENMLQDSFVPKASASTFSFKLPSETDSVIKTSASNFSFKVTPENGSKLSSFGKISQENAKDYTPIEKLTESEKEQYSASTFTLGKIPTKPPPAVLCF